MADVATAAGLDVEGLVFRAALLAGHGRDAQGLARRFAGVVEGGRARSCLDAGAPLQLTIDAPGPPGLRIGVRLGDRLTAHALSALMPEPALRRALDYLAPLPPVAHASLGTWLFWTATRQSLFVDLRDPDPTSAIARLEHVLDAAQRERFDRVRRSMIHARPWVLRVEAGSRSMTRVHLHWLLDRHASPASTADLLAPGCWPRAVAALGALLRTPGGTGRWVFVTPLDGLSEPALRAGNSGWAVVPEDDRKHRAIGELIRELGGPRDHAEALWSLCRSAAGPTWRVGRACELRVGADDGGVRARLFFTPHIREMDERERRVR